MHMAIRGCTYSAFWWCRHGIQHNCNRRFYKESGGTQEKVASIDGDLGKIFPVISGAIPRFNETFYGCTGLTSLPSTLFASIDTSSTKNTGRMFYYTFSGCSGLTSLPATLFASVDTSSATNTGNMFQNTFYGCTGLTSLPTGLFSTINTQSATNTSNMFFDTFYGCTGLTSLPATLFASVDTSSATNTSYMFAETFYGCTGLTSLPATLFASVDTSSAKKTSYMFYRTFLGCTNMTGYIPPTTFPSTIVPGSSSSANMWYQTFYNTQLATTCPAGTSQYITGFESDWGYSNENTSTSGTNRVSCGCSGTLPANASWVAGTCNWTCDSGYFDIGGTCAEDKFHVTTTSDATSLVFTMTATGTFYVNCGDGGTLTQNTSNHGTLSGQTITRTAVSTGQTIYTCSWPSAGAHTVRFGGAATGYSTSTNDAAISFYKSSGGTQAKVASIDGDLGKIFPVISGAIPQFSATFYGCTGLTSLPSTLFASIDISSVKNTSRMFNGTFYGCTGF